MHPVRRYAIGTRKQSIFLTIAQDKTCFSLIAPEGRGPYPGGLGTARKVVFARPPVLTAARVEGEMTFGLTNHGDGITKGRSGMLTSSFGR